MRGTSSEQMRFDDQSQIRDVKPVITMKLPTVCSLFPSNTNCTANSSSSAYNLRQTPRNQMTTQASDTCFSTTDHWWAFQLIKQKTAEWHGTLCVAAIDVKNALGTVEHRSSWSALYGEVRSHTYRCSHNKYGTPTLSLTHTHSNMLFHPAAILLPLKRILCQFRFSLEFCSRRTEYSFFGGALRKSFASSRDSWTRLRRTTREIGRRCCTIAATTKCTTRRKSLFAQTRMLTLLVLVVDISPISICSKPMDARIDDSLENHESKGRTNVPPQIL